MPAINTYEKRVGVQGGVLPVVRLDNQGGQGLAALGRGMGDIGQGLAVGAQVDRAKQDDQDALTAANALSAGEERWNQRSTELKQGWTVGSEDLRKTSDKEFAEWKTQQKAALTSEKAKVWFDQNAERMRSRNNQDLYNYQDKATTSKVAADTKVGMDQDYQVLAGQGGRDRLDDVVGRRLEALNAQTRLSEGQRTEISAAYMKESAESVERGEMRRDPAGWLQKRVAPQGAQAEPKDYGLREDGTKKGPGFLGELKRPDGNVSTELSIGVEFDGREREIPMLVPTLTKKEVDHLLEGGKPTDEIVDKAVAHARKRISDGKDVFAGAEDGPKKPGSAGAAPQVAGGGGPGEPKKGATVFDALLNQESGTSQFNKDGTVKTSSAGAIGIAQVMPGTGPEAAKLAGLPWDPEKFKTDPAYNKALGRAYFEKQLDTFGGDVPKALAAYNMGPGSAAKGNGVAGLVAKYGDNWLAHAPGETKNYVTSIVAAAGQGAPTGVGGAPGAQPSMTAQLSNGGIAFAEDAPKTFGVLGDQKQYQMVDEAQRLMRQSEAVKRGEADRLLADAAAMHKDGKTDPFNLTPEYFTASYGAADGAAKFAAYAGGRAMASDISNFATQTDAQIRATLAATKPELGTGYAGADARQSIRVAAAEQVAAQRREDPMLFAQRNGLTTSAPIDMGKPEGIGTELNARIGTARLMADQYGTPLRILTNGEAAQMSAALRLMPTQQKLNYLDQVRTGLLQDSRSYKAVLDQIAPDSPVTALAGELLVEETTLTIDRWGADTVLQPRNVAGLILEGEAILNPTKKDKQEDGRGGKFPMPKEIDMTTQFNGFVGESFRGNPAGYAKSYQAFKAYYAGSASRKGVLSDALDSSLAKESALAVTGGVIDYNGLGTVMKPWGMPDGEFKDRLSGAFNQAMEANGLKGSPMDDLSAYGLQSVGDGHYLVTNGQNFLNGPRGPIELNISKPTMREKLSLTSSAWVPPPDTKRRQSGRVTE